MLWFVIILAVVAFIVFPTNLLAGVFGHTRREFFSLDDERRREGPKVAFS